MVGKPWDGVEAGDEMREVEYGGEKLKKEHLRELSGILERDRDKFRWLLEDDVEIEGGWLEENGRRNWAPPKRGEAESIRFLVDKFVFLLFCVLCDMDMSLCLYLRGESY